MNLKNLLAVLLAALGLMAFGTVATGCETETGESIEDAAEDAGDTMEDAAEDAGDAIDDTVDDMDDEMDN